MSKKKVDGSSSSRAEEKEFEDNFMRLTLPPDGEEIKSHFFRIIHCPSEQLHKLKLPPAFIMESGDSLSDYAYLKAPGGTDHRVKLTKEEGDIWFSDGWEDFIASYSLAYGHFLVFRYQGDSHFHVFIFDPDCNETKYPISNEEEEEDEKEDSDSDSDSDSGKAIMSEALERAEAFKCDNPRFIVTMHVSYLSNDFRMWIPLRHANKYMNVGVDDNTIVKLHLGRKIWPVKITYGNRCFRFGVGWRRFATHNGLCVDDVCVFELIDQTALAYKVHIFRAAS